MAKNSKLCTHRERGVIAREIIKDGVSEQNKTMKKLTTSLNQFKNISSEDAQHKETSHVN